MSLFVCSEMSPPVHVERVVVHFVNGNELFAWGEAVETVRIVALQKVTRFVLLAIVDHQPVNITERHVELAVEKGLECIFNRFGVEILGSDDQVGYLGNRNLVDRSKGATKRNVLDGALGPASLDPLVGNASVPCHRVADVDIDWLS